MEVSTSMDGEMNAGISYFSAGVQTSAESLSTKPIPDAIMSRYNCSLLVSQNFSVIFAY
ncbi:UNVERIFIED_CONTAM: hypothetical protein BJ099_13218 [Lysinibacillus xylanilyticus]